LTEGSVLVEGVLTVLGAFSPGEVIEGAGLDPGTTIVAVKEGGVLELSAPVQVGKSGLGVALSAHQSFSEPTQVAVDSDPESPSSGDVYVVDQRHRVVDKFTAGGEYLGQLTGFAPERPFQERLSGLGAISGVAVDASGRLLIAGEHNAEERGVGVFSNGPVNVLTSFFQIGGSAEQRPGAGMAVDPLSAQFYVPYENSLGTQLVDGFSGEGQLLRELLVAETPFGLAVEAGSGDLYVGLKGRVERFDSTGHLVEVLGVKHLVGGGSVAVGAGGTVFVTDGGAGVVDVFPLEPTGPPTVESEGVSNVAATSGTFDADLNPRGGETTYAFEYGRCASVEACSTAGYESSLPVGGGKLAADFAVHSVTVHPQDLLSGSAYHFRVVAHNTFGNETSHERVFTTQGVGGQAALLDGRRWEMVSPPDKHGALVETIHQEHITQASADGRAFTFLTDAPTESEPAGYANLVQVLAGRGPNGWSTTDIASAHAGVSGASLFTGQEFRFFSENLEAGVVQPIGGFTPGLSPVASEQTPYLRADYLNGNVSEPCVAPRPGAVGPECYTPLVVSCPAAGGEPCRAPVAEHANVEAGTTFGEEGRCPPKLFCGPQFVAASPDAKHVIVTSNTPLVAGAVPGSLYEWSAGTLALVSLLPLPDGKPGANAALGLGSLSMRGAVSNDGSRVVWSEAPRGGHLFVRDTARGETVMLDTVQAGGSGAGTVDPQFQFASADGSRVFFTDSQALTAGSGAGGPKALRDLYECDVVVVAGKLSCRLSDLTPEGAGGAADVQNEVLGGSADGSTVYFVANGVLAPGAQHGNCAELNSVFGAGCSLYVWHDGVVGFVARLSADDYPDWNGHSSPFRLTSMVSGVSGDGRWLVFMSDRGLDGYDSRDAVTGRAAEEVYLFDSSRAVVEGGPGVVGNPVCVSCDPTGARPVAVEYSQLEESGIDGHNELWEPGRMIAGSVPSWVSYANGALYQPRFLSGSGRVFFNASGGLVSSDVNGALDVYEFEPVGVPAGSEQACRTGGVGFVGGAGGCLGLVSSGSSASDSGFLDASASGGDAFFFTTAKLSANDFDQSRDVYDAHECTAAVPCLSEPRVVPGACDSEESCKGSVGGGIEGPELPSSETFVGSGNTRPSPSPKAKGRKSAKLSLLELLKKALKACHAKAKRFRAGCERHARQKYVEAKRHAKSGRRAVRGGK